MDWADGYTNKNYSIENPPHRKKLQEDKFLNIFRPFVNGTCYVLIQLYKLHNHLQFEVRLHSVIAVDTTATGDDRPAENLMLS